MADLFMRAPGLELSLAGRIYSVYDLLFEPTKLIQANGKMQTQINLT